LDLAQIYRFIFYYQLVEEVLDFPTSMLDYATTQCQKRLITTGVPEYWSDGVME
jgi:hypothetical protein